MAYSFSLQKSTVAKVVGLSLVMMLVGCSSDQRYKREVSGDEAYLDAVPLKALNAPAGMILPVQSGNYGVPAITLKGSVGKQLDIRPPVQPLALLSGSHAQYNGDSGTLLLENSLQNQHLWSRVVSILQAKQITIASRQDAAQTLTTDWVKWNRLDEDTQYQGRYQISVQQQGYQQALVVKSVGLQQQGKTAPESDLSEIQRYNGVMMNTIIEALNKQDNLASRQSASWTDDTALPMLVVRGPYTVVWDRLPAALEKLGMKVGDRNRPQGSVAVSYKTLSRSDWDALGVKEPELAKGNYKLQVGDLNNRTSLQFIDAKGRPLTESQNDGLVAVFQFAFSHTVLTKQKGAEAPFCLVSTVSFAWQVWRNSPVSC
ncbi:outer membrane protein assembly factor BamC [Serratia symbiotica]|uniref:outer membrane protein assembly factor BamC n=1 Tax=Serratia symbiotica TaxID=138074 RepID=UPI002091CC59|nr:outer membrane protein assembly factor BamC [Serratia symbiotica]MCX2957345.1 outer membrane protein assembly factor BamC [Serratia symbiotica]USS96136.1 outer membrane protein assembly factor BamC [Serratia symbiotica]